MLNPFSLKGNIKDIYSIEASAKSNKSSRQQINKSHTNNLSFFPLTLPKCQLKKMWHIL